MRIDITRLLPVLNKKSPCKQGLSSKNKLAQRLVVKLLNDIT
ncbi:hypothetical protein FX988_03257 [Paraglaciecola mesophila]|uniref:Uncharacterized protein n=1 Tax=Paraglaciecola mesophila TaxID=197222 RepID=A0A857JLP8_9ALTE|nr:hypothetical protein FX988_03257 [Paraglaciecola mesophila]